MDFKNLDINAIAQLACLRITEDELNTMTTGFEETMSLIENINQVNTDGLEPMAHPLGVCQSLRPDEVTEKNQRKLLQSIAPHVVAGFYQVPQFVENE